MQSLNEMLGDNSVSDRAVFLALRDAVELGLHSVHLRRYDGIFCSTACCAKLACHNSFLFRDFDFADRSHLFSGNVRQQTFGKEMFFWEIIGNIMLAVISLEEDIMPLVVLTMVSTIKCSGCCIAWGLHGDWC